MAYSDYLNPGTYIGKYADPLGVNKPPATADTDQLRVQGLEGGLRQTQIGQGRDATILDKTDQNQSAQQQAAAIAQLRAQAAGTTPSAAQTQLQQQAQIDAARQTGLARAIQGQSAGGNAYRAAVGAANTTANANATGVALKANEMATARGQLADALTQARGQDIGAYKGDVDERNTLLAAQLQQQQTAQQIAGANVAAQQTAAGYQNQLDAAKIGGAGAGLGTYLGQRGSGGNPYANVGDGTGSNVYAPVGEPNQVTSDYRAKRNVRMVSAIRSGGR